MKWNRNTQRAAGLGIVALIGWASGVWLPPEVVAEIMGAFG